MLGLCCCSSFSLVVGRGLLSSCSVCASHCRAFSCCEARALEHLGFSSCTHGTLWHRLQLWHMGLVAPHHAESSGPGIKLVSPELAGGFFTTEPPGKPHAQLLKMIKWDFPGKPVVKNSCYPCKGCWFDPWSGN